MKSDATANPAETYPVRAVVRLTGLSPEVLRAWERRYQAVEPIRTPGGTRRYRAEDIRKLRLLKKAVDSGGRIGHLAKLPSEELERRATEPDTRRLPALDELMEAISTLEVVTTQRLLSQLFAAVGAARFASDVACPLLREIGARWERGELSVASEHLATATLRSMLGAVLHHIGPSPAGLSVLFATPPGERHELGLLMAAITAASAGARPTYLGPDLPIDEILSAIKQTRPHVLALSVVCLDADQAKTQLLSLREQIDARVKIWVGGAGSESIALAGVDCLSGLEALENRIALLLASEISS